MKQAIARIALAFAALCAVPSFASAGPAINDPPPRIAADGNPVPLKIGQVDQNELEALAQREKSAQQLSEFQGGDPVVIVLSTTAIIVALVVLVLLFAMD